MEERKEQVRAAIVGFFDTKGGHRRVAEDIGLSEQTLYNIVKGRNAVTFDTMLLLSEVYGADFAPVLQRVFSLNNLMAVQPAQAQPSADVDRIKAERDWYKQISEKLEVRTEKLEEKLDAANQTLAELSKLNFPESGSQSTDLSSHYYPQERLVVQGFQLPKGPLNILKTIGCTLDADGVWGVPFTPMDIVVRV